MKESECKRKTEMNFKKKPRHHQVRSSGVQHHFLPLSCVLNKLLNEFDGMDVLNPANITSVWLFVQK